MDEARTMVPDLLYCPGSSQYHFHRLLPQVRLQNTTAMRSRVYQERRFAREAECQRNFQLGFRRRLNTPYDQLHRVHLY